MISSFTDLPLVAQESVAAFHGVQHGCAAPTGEYAALARSEWPDLRDAQAALCAATGVRGRFLPSRSADDFCATRLLTTEDYWIWWRP